MAERTKFTADITSSMKTCAILYPISGHSVRGGGLKLLGLQPIGILSVFAWCMATGFLMFYLIKLCMASRYAAKENCGGSGWWNR
jgi:ammonia channel protein AmtB